MLIWWLIKFNYPDSWSFKFQSLGSDHHASVCLVFTARPRYLDTLPNFMCSWFVKFSHQNGDSHAATTRMTQYPGPGPSPSLGGHSVIHDPCGHRLSRYKRPPECARKAAKTRDPSCDDQSKRGYVEQPMGIQPTTRSTRVLNQFRLRMMLHKKGPAPGAG